jgi:probable phosphoglycerate mutase
MATTAFLVRHAVHDRVDSTLVGRMEGVGLGAAGRAQAEALAARLAREPIAELHSSPQRRARETAAPIALRLGLAVEVCAAIDEIDFGDWTGRDFGALADDPAWRLWNERRGAARPPGGESMAEVQVRAVAHLRRAAAAHPGGAVALVSHGDVIKAMVMDALGLPLDAHWRLDIAPASVSVLALWPGGARLLRLNEILPA